MSTSAKYLTKAIISFLPWYCLAPHLEFTLCHVCHLSYLTTIALSLITFL